MLLFDYKKSLSLNVTTTWDKIPVRDESMTDEKLEETLLNSALKKE